MLKIVSVYNIKGGVGKTTTAVNLAYLAAREGRGEIDEDDEEVFESTIVEPGDAAAQHAMATAA